MFKHWFIAFSAIMIFVACGQPPQTRYFTLDYPLTPKSPLSPLPLFIQRFDAGPMLDQDCLLYKTSPYEIRRDPYRRWAQSPQELLTENIKLFFKNSGYFQVTERIPMDREAYELFGRILHFEEIIEAGRRSAYVAMWFEAGHVGRRQVLLSQVIEKRAPIAGNQPEDIVRAMSEATSAVFHELAQALEQALPRD